MTPFLRQYAPHLACHNSAVAFLAVIPQGSASSFAFAFAPEIGPGFSLDIQPLSTAWALARGTLSPESTA
jgi:hypothetical protein